MGNHESACCYIREDQIMPMEVPKKSASEASPTFSKTERKRRVDGRGQSSNIRPTMIKTIPPITDQGLLTTTTATATSNTAQYNHGAQSLVAQKSQQVGGETTEEEWGYSFSGLGTSARKFSFSSLSTWASNDDTERRNDRPIRRRADGGDGGVAANSNNTNTNGSTVGTDSSSAFFVGGEIANGNIGGNHFGGGQRDDVSLDESLKLNEQREEVGQNVRA